MWLVEAIAKGRVKAPGYFIDASIREAWSKCVWNGPSQGMLDPLKEINAARKRVELGVSTRQKETMEMNGGSFDDNAEQLLREAEKMGEINQLLNPLMDSSESSDGAAEREEGENEGQDAGILRG